MKKCGDYIGFGLHGNSNNILLVKIDSIKAVQMIGTKITIITDVSGHERFDIEPETARCFFEMIGFKL